MKTSRKTKIYDKGLRILWREIHRLDLKSKKPEGLSSFEISDLVKMLKPLEATIKDEAIRKTKKELPSEMLVRQAEEILRQYHNGKEAADESDSANSGSPTADEI